MERVADCLASKLEGALKIITEFVRTATAAATSAFATTASETEDRFAL